MKFGYLYWADSHRPMSNKKFVNYGDPVQSLATINLYREMGIPEKDIVPINRYNTKDYNGEELVLTFNGNHAEYFSRLLSTELFPYSTKIIPVFFSFHLRLATITENEIQFLSKHQPIGCRDAYTYDFMTQHGVDAYISGCLSLTFPIREKTDKQNKVFLVDCPESLLEFIPNEIRENAVSLSQVAKISSVSNDSSLTHEENEQFHSMAYEQLSLLRDEAKLVVTSRLHVATPCLAMGIPVICVKNRFDVRFFIKKFLPLYTPDKWDKIDWRPVPPNVENEKQYIKDCFFSTINAVASRFRIHEVYKNVDYSDLAVHNFSGILSTISLPPAFKYAIWGCYTPQIFNLYNELAMNYQNSFLVNMIDSNVKGKMLGVDIIHPDKIECLPKEVIIFVLPPSIQKMAKELLIPTGRPFVLFEESKLTLYI